MAAALDLPGEVDEEVAQGLHVVPVVGPHQNYKKRNSMQRIDPFECMKTKLKRQSAENQLFKYHIKILVFRFFIDFLLHR